MADSSNPSRQSQAEFITLMAILISLVALSTDAMLPALPLIASELGAAHANQGQLVIGAFFVGFSVGQLLYGPLSDSIGRKSSILIGVAIFLLGCLLSTTAQDFETMMIGRVLQGLGTASPRTVTLAIVRDLYAGRAMARIMSFVMAVFIIVPALAPSIGQAIEFSAGWRAIFMFLAALGLIVSLWMVLRLEETLPKDRRVRFSIRRIASAARETLTTRAALGYTLAAGAVFSAFIGYLNSAQQIFQDVFKTGELFPLFFAVLAAAIGTSSIINGRLVMRLGMRTMSFIGVGGLTFFSAIFTVVLLIDHALVPLWAFMLWGVLSFLFVGILFGNLNSLAMEPLGHIAGTGSAVVGATSTMISIVVGGAIGQAFDGTVMPLILGFAILGSVSGLIMIITNRGLTSG